MTEHFVQVTLRSGDYPSIEFTCTAPEGAYCRQVCQTCSERGEEACMCAVRGEQPVMVPTPCNYVEWMQDCPFECYDGPNMAVRGPEPAPVIFQWNGDNYDWEYADG